MEGSERKFKQALRFISLGKNDPNYVKKITFEPLILLEWINNHNKHRGQKERKNKRKKEKRKETEFYHYLRQAKAIQYLA